MARRKPLSVKALEDFGRERLSEHFFMRDFLYSEISAIHGIPNVPDDPDLAIAAGTALCENLLEPLHDIFGRVSIRSSFRCAAVNDYGNKNNLNCEANRKAFGRHIWDHRDADGNMGATSCIVLPWFIPHFEASGDWRPLAWFIHDHLPYSDMYFFPKNAAFNLTWSERQKREIHSYAQPHRGCLTKPGMDNHAGDHSDEYPGFPGV